MLRPWKTGLSRADADGGGGNLLGSAWVRATLRARRARAARGTACAGSACWAAAAAASCRWCEASASSCPSRCASAAPPSRTCLRGDGRDGETGRDDDAKPDVRFRVSQRGGRCCWQVDTAHHHTHQATDWRTRRGETEKKRTRFRDRNQRYILVFATDPTMLRIPPARVATCIGFAGTSPWGAEAGNWNTWFWACGFSCRGGRISAAAGVGPEHLPWWLGRLRQYRLHRTAYRQRSLEERRKQDPGRCYKSQLSRRTGWTLSFSTVLGSHSASSQVLWFLILLGIRVCIWKFLSKIMNLLILLLKFPPPNNN